MSHQHGGKNSLRLGRKSGRPLQNCLNSKGSVESIRHLLFILRGIAIEELELICNDVDRYYHTRLEKTTSANGTTKERPITTSQGALRYLQFQIKERISVHMIRSPYAYGGIKGRDHVRAANAHRGKKYHWKTDLTDCFPSITSQMVYDMFIRRGFSFTVARYLTRLTTFKGSVPQGVSTSSYIVNLVLEPLDEEIAAIMGPSTRRVMDDIIASDSRPILNDRIGLSIAAIRRYGQKPKRKKTRSKIGPIEYTGLRILNNSLSTTPAFEEKIKNAEPGSNRHKGLLGYQKYVRRGGCTESMPSKD